MATMPPGLSTRRTSAKNAARSAMCMTLSSAHTASNVPSGYAESRKSTWRKCVRSADALLGGALSGPLRLRGAERDALHRAPEVAARWMAGPPMPQPTSTTRAPRGRPEKSTSSRTSRSAAAWRSAPASPGRSPASQKPWCTCRPTAARTGRSWCRSRPRPRRSVRARQVRTGMRNWHLLSQSQISEWDHQLWARSRIGTHEPGHCMGGAQAPVNARYIACHRPRPAASEIAQADAHHVAIHGETVYRPGQTFTGVK